MTFNHFSKQTIIIMYEKKMKMKMHKKIDSRMGMLLFSVIWWVMMIKVVGADPQANLLTYGCSQYMTDNVSEFRSHLHAVFSDVRAQLNSGKYFATSQIVRGSEPVFTLAQCRKYLSTPDCVTCFTMAASLIRNCSDANGGRVIYDGCFLRYESNTFFDQISQEGHNMICGNQTASTAYGASVASLLSDLQTATPRIDGFFAISKKEVEGGQATVYGVAQCVETIGPSNCQDCLKMAYADMKRCLTVTNSRATNAGCFLRYSDTPFFANNQITDLKPFLEKGRSNKITLLIAALVGGAGLLLLATVLFLCFMLSRKRKATPRGNILGETELPGPVNYSYEDLKSATKNFGEECKLGEGGFGEVYKGVFKNGKIVAVKKLVISQSQRAQIEFETEVKIISNVQHRNLARLLGCCNKGPELLLVYEYMANSSLDKFLFGERQGSLNWKQRFDIILGTAKGLAYLHEDFHSCVIHRDIKSSNILLDDDFQPKIADFGLIRLLSESQTHLSTKFAGTLGYTAPEYAIYGQLSEKVDIYSYGVVVLEIISGRKCSETTQDSNSEHLLKRAWKLYETGMYMELVDERIDPNEYQTEEIKKIIEIALLCTQSSASLRPTMFEVVALLRFKGLQQYRLPTRPGFVDAYEKVLEDTPISIGLFSSKATASISHFSGR